MENLSAVNCASAGTGGCGQVRAKQLKRHFHVCFSPQALLENFLRGRGAKPWYFTALEAPRRNSIAAVGFRFWESSKTRAKVLHPEDPPHLFWKPKKHVEGGGYFTWLGEIRRPRQTQGGARQGIRQASLAAPAARAATVAAAACSSGRISELARPSEARCFPPGRWFFQAVLLQQPQATEAVEKGCFSRISDDTLGSFLAWFWN